MIKLITPLNIAYIFFNILKNHKTFMWIHYFFISFCWFVKIHSCIQQQTHTHTFFYPRFQWAGSLVDIPHRRRLRATRRKIMQRNARGLPLRQFVNNANLQWRTPRRCTRWFSDISTQLASCVHVCTFVRVTRAFLSLVHRRTTTAPLLYFRFRGDATRTAHNGTHICKCARGDRATHVRSNNIVCFIMVGVCVFVVRCRWQISAHALLNVLMCRPSLYPISLRCGTSAHMSRDLLARLCCPSSSRIGALLHAFVHIVRGLPHTHTKPPYIVRVERERVPIVSLSGVWIGSHSDGRHHACGHARLIQTARILIEFVVGRWRWTQTDRYTHTGRICPIRQRFVCGVRVVARINSNVIDTIAEIMDGTHTFAYISAFSHPYFWLLPD